MNRPKSALMAGGCYSESSGLGAAYLALYTLFSRLDA
jgi:hypothetical protein